MIKRYQLHLFVFLLAVLISSCTCHQKKAIKKTSVMQYYAEQYRPQYHFTPDSMWMNDPNGMVYYQGEYHLFYQYYPDSIIWGPMHWGHAISTDLMHWQHLPIAIYPDTLGWIFSGSAVVDIKNTSGLGTTENPPMVAIFTLHDRYGEKAGKIDFETQGIAYSLDKGRTWKMYKNNPVIANPGIKDFRDPKVIWSKEHSKWIMALAMQNHVGFFSSSDLKSWTHESDFGKDVGSHGGVWECPDFFPIEDQNGIEKWVLLVSINPGGPNGGSATQYFVGNFNGKGFVNENPSVNPMWLDHGKDNYAGVTWSDVPEVDGRRIFLGWMSNWQYAQKVPTKKWRNAMTLPRELKLIHNDSAYQLAVTPVAEVNAILNHQQAQSELAIDISDEAYLLFNTKVKGGAWMLELTLDAMQSKSIDIKVKNDLNEAVILKLNIGQAKINFDRTNAGKRNFSHDFAVPICGSYTFNKSTQKVQLYWDQSSFEIFVNNGEFQMTNLAFPSKNWSAIELSSVGNAKLINATYTPINSTWK